MNDKGWLDPFRARPVANVRQPNSQERKVEVDHGYLGHKDAKLMGLWLVDSFRTRLTWEDQVLAAPVLAEKTRYGCFQQR